MGDETTTSSGSVKKSSIEPKVSWKETANNIQGYRDASIVTVIPSIPEAPQSKDLTQNVAGLPRQLLQEPEIEITETIPEKLVALLAEGKLTSVEVVGAFLRRAAVAQKLTNCITELLPQRAMSRAAELDKYFEKHKKPKGALHGLPISVKEHIGMKGLDLNAGFISWVGRTAEDDADILKILSKAGAVFYARTTEPQTLMHLETSSNIYGVTVNPFNRSLTAGGSSGGEGALLGIRGSCLGIGTDIGGSIRSPAANNGVYGLRPTTYRLPMNGLSSTNCGEEQVVPVIGPMSTSLGGIKLFMRTVIAGKPWRQSPSLVPIPWREIESFIGSKLKVAVLWDDGVVKPHPPVLRALKEVVEKLKIHSDIEIVDWKPYKHDKAWEIIASLYYADGASEVREAIEASGEPWRPLSRFIITENPHVKLLSIPDVWKWTVAREDYRVEYAKIWNSTATGEDGEGEVDVILCPAGPGAAPPLDCSRYWGYTSQWNLLDYPALVFPVSKVDPETDVREEGYEPINEQDAYNYQLYDPDLYRDAPVSLQLVGRRYEDEKVIQALEMITERIALPFVKYM